MSRPARCGRPVIGITAPYGVRGARTGHEGSMFLFFSNRLGWAGSLLLSAAVTVVLFLVFAR